MSATTSPQRPLYAWLAAGAAAALIALSMFVSIALAAPHAAAPHAAAPHATAPRPASAVTPTAAEAALNVLPHSGRTAESPERSCARIHLGFGLRCLAGDLF